MPADARIRPVAYIECTVWSDTNIRRTKVELQLILFWSGFFLHPTSEVSTIELLLGIEPMNQLDATATPINIFRAEPDLRPYKALLPNIALDNLVTPPPRDVATAYWMRLTEEQDLQRADMADPEILNRIIWFSVRGNIPMPSIARLPAFDAMRLGLQEEREEIAEKVGTKKHKDDDD